MLKLVHIAAPVLATVGLIAACTTEEPPASPSVDAGAADASPPDAGNVDAGDGGDHGECPHTSHEFSYEESETTGPQHWKDIVDEDGKPKYEACGGKHDGGDVQQSPLAIDPTTLPPGESGFELVVGTHLKWGTTALVTSLWNNGHTWQAGFAGQSHALVANGGTEYGLRQFHFHAPAEHAMGGKEYPLEMHFVHVSPTGNAFDDAPFAAVIGVMFEEDPSGQDNPELAKIWSRFSKCAQDKDEAIEGVSLDLAALLPTDRSYVMYDGSLTTPPCSVKVRFHLLTHPIRASAKQIEALTEAVGRNDRPHQPRLPSTTVTVHEQP